MAELDLASLVVSVRADVRDASTGIDQLNKKIDGISGSVKQAGQDTASVQQEMKNGWVGLSAQLSVFNELQASIGKPLLNFFKNAVNGASDLQETISKTNIVFKEYANDVMEWSENSTRTMGLSQQSALSMASAYGDLATSMGLATSTSKSMAMELTQLAADLASFKNIDAQQAFTALQGIFTGNAQALKGLGVVMNETTLEAFALSQGITKSYQSMSEAEKVALRYQFVLAQTANAQGDFERTSSGFANASRTLEQSWSELCDSLGSMLLPVLETVIGVITDIVQFVNDLPDGLKAVITSLGVATTAFTVLVPVILKCVNILKAFQDALKTTEAITAISMAKISAIVIGITALISGLAKMYAEAQAKSEASAREIKKVRDELLEVDKVDPTIDIAVKQEEATNKISNVSTLLNGLSDKAVSLAVNTEGLPEWMENGISELEVKLNSATTIGDLLNLETDFIELEAKIKKLSVDMGPDWIPPEDLAKVQEALNELADLKLYVFPSLGGTTETNKQALIDMCGTIQSQLDSLEDYNKAHMGVLIAFDPEGNMMSPQEWLEQKGYDVAQITAKINSASTEEDWEEVKKLITDITANVVLAYPSGSEVEGEVQTLYDYFAALQNIPVTIDVKAPTPFNMDIIKLNTVNAIKRWNLEAKLAVLLPDGQEKGEQFAKAFNDAVSSLYGLVTLEFDQTSPTAIQALQLIDRLEEIKNGITGDITLKIPSQDITAMNDLARDFTVISSASETLWSYNNVKTLKEISEAIYKRRTGEDATGSLYADLQSLYDLINNGEIGENSLFAQINSAIENGISLTDSWKDAISNVITEIGKIPAEYLNTQRQLNLQFAGESILRGLNAGSTEERDMYFEEARKYFQSGVDVNNQQQKLLDLFSGEYETFEDYLAAISKVYDLSKGNGLDTTAPERKLTDYIDLMSQGATLYTSAFKDMANDATEASKSLNIFEESTSATREAQANYFKELTENYRGDYHGDYLYLKNMSAFQKYFYDGDYEEDLQRVFEDFEMRAWELAERDAQLADLQRYASFEGGEYKNREELQEAMVELAAQMETASDEDRALMQTTMDYFNRLDSAFVVKGIAQMYLDALGDGFKGFTEEQLAGMDDIQKEFASALQALYENGNLDFNNLDTRMLMMESLAPWLEKINTGTGDTEAQEVVNGTKNDVKGDLVQGNKHVGDINYNYNYGYVPEQPTVMQMYDGAVAESTRIANSIGSAIYGGTGSGGE